MHSDSSVMDEPKYTLAEIAENWKVHRTTARRLFIDEPGVVKLGHGPRRGKRQHFTIRVPHSVAVRVLGKLIVR